MGWKSIISGVGALAIALAIAPTSASAAPDGSPVVYQWTDADGVVRYTAHPDRIPEASLADALVIRRDAVGAVVSARWREEAGATLAATRPGQESVARIELAIDPGEAAVEPAVVREPVPVEAKVAFAPAPARVDDPGAYAIQLEAHPVSDWVRPLDRLHLLEGRRLYRTTVEIVRLTDADDATVGFTVRTDWKLAGDACVLWWSVSPDGTIIKIDAVGESCDRTTKLALDSLAGATTDRLGECATATELAALEVLVVCRPQTRKR